MILSDLYRQHIYKVRSNIAVYASKSKYLRVRLLLERNAIVKSYNRIAYIFKFDIRKFDEIKNPYNNSPTTVNNKLIYKMLALNTNKFGSELSEEAERYRLQIINYCKLQNSAFKTRALFRYYCKHLITIDEYKRLLTNYFKIVNNKILDGDAYMMGNRLGNIFITRYKIDKDSPSYNNFIDLKATAALKRDILNKGLIPYNKLDAEACAKQGIKYKGIPYIIYGTTEDYIFKLVWNNCKVVNYRKMKFVKSNYNYTGNNLMDIIPDLNSYSETDIRNLDCSVGFRLSLLREKNKHIENNYVIWENKNT